MNLVFVEEDKPFANNSHQHFGGLTTQERASEDWARPSQMFRNIEVKICFQTRRTKGNATFPRKFPQKSAALFPTFEESLALIYVFSIFIIFLGVVRLQCKTLFILQSTQVPYFIFCEPPALLTVEGGEIVERWRHNGIVVQCLWISRHKIDWSKVWWQIMLRLFHEFDFLPDPAMPKGVTFLERAESGGGLERNRYERCLASSAESKFLKLGKRSNCTWDSRQSPLLSLILFVL